MSLSILHQDEHILVLNKPSGLAFLADRGGETCLWDLLPTITGKRKPLQVHRLDKGTSGVLLVALSPWAQSSLTRQLSERLVQKTYAAVCLGMWEHQQGVIDLPLRPGRKSRFRIAGPRESIRVTSNSFGIPVWSLPEEHIEKQRDIFESVTRFHVMEQRGGYSMLSLQPETGRTHQLRVHLSWLGHAIVGDTLYGKPNSSEQKAERLMLHCARMTFTCEWLGTGEQLEINAPLPSDFRRITVED